MKTDTETRAETTDTQIKLNVYAHTDTRDEESSGWLSSVLTFRNMATDLASRQVLCVCV